MSLRQRARLRRVVLATTGALALGVVALAVFAPASGATAAVGYALGLLVHEVTQ